MKPSRYLTVSLLCLLAWGLTACGVGDEALPEAEKLTTTAASSFYVDPSSEVMKWVERNAGDGRAERIRQKIANQPQAKWLGDWVPDVKGEVEAYTSAAAKVDKLPILVAYNIPGRDCGNFSSGGAGSPEAYRAWIHQFAVGVGERNAVVILEPDALPLLLDCYQGEEARAVTDLLSFAVSDLNRYAPNAKIYLDAGHSDWKSPAEMATRLKAANVAKAAGFALNTSNYRWIKESESYGNDVVAKLGGKSRFVIDTSRNGAGPAGKEWCNPAGRRLGATSRIASRNAGLEMLLWIKAPGQSDGDCGIGKGSRAGDFLPQVAYELAR